jgi:hypothetical protein
MSAWRVGRALVRGGRGLLSAARAAALSPARDPDSPAG